MKEKCVLKNKTKNADKNKNFESKFSIYKNESFLEFPELPVYRAKKQTFTQ